jgi:predicted O-methyltransferase YrrM
VALIKRPARYALRATGILPHLPPLSAVVPLPLSPKWEYRVQALPATGDPIAEIVASDALAPLAQQIEAAPFIAPSLLSPTSRALLYAVIRATRPEHVVEIGTFRGGTAEVMARALYDNRVGTLHTVSPHDREHFGPSLAKWPVQLRGCTVFHAIDSMAFFMLAADEGIRPGIVLVDGNHDYEFAAFDIWSAARLITPGGFIFVDNISQWGPYRAAMDFLAANPGWQNCGSPQPPESNLPFDKTRYSVRETDFMVLRAPANVLIGARPECMSEIVWDDRPLHGIRLVPVERATGTLTAQCMLRAFAAAENVEIMVEASADYADADVIELRFAEPLQIDGDYLRWAIEPWLSWRGDKPLALRSPPTPF